VIAGSKHCSTDDLAISQVSVPGGDADEVFVFGADNTAFFKISLKLGAGASVFGSP
jgi:hypothetical protein